MLCKAWLLLLAAPSLVQVEGRHHRHHHRKTVSQLPHYTVREARLENVKVQVAQEEARNAMQLVQRHHRHHHHHHHGHHHLRKRSLGSRGVDEVRAFAKAHMMNEMRTKQEIKAEIAKVMHTTDVNEQKIKSEIKNVERHMRNHHHRLSEHHGHHIHHHGHHNHHHGHHSHHHGHHSHHHGHHSHHRGRLHKRAAVPFLDFDHAIQQANNLNTLTSTVTQIATATSTITHDLAHTHYDYHVSTETVIAPVDSTQTVIAPVDPTQTVIAPVTSTQTVIAPVDPTQNVIAPVDPAQVIIPGQPRPDHRCGVEFGGAPCHTGECCGEHGFCGTSAEHCAGRCQLAFGICDSSIGDIPGTTRPREDNRCGTEFGNARCHFGECCSTFGHCGITSDHCSEEMCHQEFGQCAFPVNGLPAVSTILIDTQISTVITVTQTQTQSVAQTTTTTLTQASSTSTAVQTLTEATQTIIAPVDPTPTVIAPVDPTQTVIAPVDPTQTVIAPVVSTQTVQTVIAPVASTQTVQTVIAPVDPTQVIIPGQPRPDHRCGVEFGDAPCHSGECCGEEGFCGTSSKHCGGRCQSAFGICDQSIGDIAGTTRPREDSRCGPSHGNARCHFGECCSSFGYCGMFEAHCAKDRCLEDFGQCAYEVDGRPAVTPITIVFPPEAPLVFVDGQPRPDHRCGVLFGDSPCNTGECCGEEGFCGTSSQHCSGGCQTPFGRCDSNSAVIPGTTYPREDNRCGPDFGDARCHYGECCSKFGHCGKLVEHCDAGFCDTKFGQCSFPVNGLSAVTPLAIIDNVPLTTTIVQSVVPVQTLTTTENSTATITATPSTTVTGVETLTTTASAESIAAPSTTVTSVQTVTTTASDAIVPVTVTSAEPTTTTLCAEEQLVKACPMEFGTDAFFDCKEQFYMNHPAPIVEVGQLSTVSTAAIPAATVVVNEADEAQESNEDPEVLAEELAEEDEELFEGEGPSERDLVEAQAQYASVPSAAKPLRTPVFTLVLASALLMVL